jgi:TorA maturation chaperone TorD
MHDTTDAGDRHDGIAEPASDRADGGTTTETTVDERDPDDAAFARSRARVYRLLAAAFDGDAAALADAIERGTFAEVGATLPVDVDLGPLDGGPPSEAALAHGYDNLFAVPGPHYVPPFASAHAGDADDPESFESDSAFREEGGGALLGTPAATMAELHESAGFSPTRGDGIPDHLAAQFEFLAVLAAAAAAAAEADDADRREDLRALQQATLDALGWLDAFDRAVGEADAVEGVFAALATFARTFAAWDARDGIGTVERLP